MRHAVRFGADEDHSKRKGRNVVLIARTAEQLAVLDARPAAADDGIDVVALEFGNEIYRLVLVKKDAHQPRSESRARSSAAIACSRLTEGN